MAAVTLTEDNIRRWSGQSGTVVGALVEAGLIPRDRHLAAQVVVTITVEAGGTISAIDVT